MAKILVVEDNAIQSRLMDQYLRSRGYEVVTAANGQDAVATARQLRPDVVLLDIQLPDLDGFEVTARLADGEAEPVVVLTSTREMPEAPAMA